MTTQAQEILYNNGDKFDLIGEPLTNFLLKNKDIRFDSFTTAHWRGYQGWWLLEDEKLFITALESANYNFEDLFNSTRPIVAEWFSGVLEYGFGDSEYDYWWGKYEQYAWMQFEKGVLVERRINDKPDKKFF